MRNRRIIHLQAGLPPARATRRAPKRQFRSERRERWSRGYASTESVVKGEHSEVKVAQLRGRPCRQSSVPLPSLPYSSMTNSTPRPRGSASRERISTWSVSSASRAPDGVQVFVRDPQAPPLLPSDRTPRSTGHYRTASPEHARRRRRSPVVTRKLMEDGGGGADATELPQAEAPGAHGPDGATAAATRETTPIPRSVVARAYESLSMSRRPTSRTRIQRDEERAQRAARVAS